jgi:N-acetylglucosaminyl-diphospho-decaprenol L-rhamnosyltransferase
MDPDAALVIVNYRTPALVERCVETVRAADPDLRLETVIVDNASRDGSAERLSASLPGVRVIAMAENRGFAAGVNEGFRDTQAELVIVLNPDTEVSSGALTALVDRLRAQPQVGLAAPMLEGPDGELQPSGYLRFPNLLTLSLEICVPLSYVLSYVPKLHPYALSPEALAGGGRVEHVTGAAMAIRRGAYEDVGPLDESFFMYLEETEWQLRLRKRGWLVELEPAARVCHLVRGGGEEALTPPLQGVSSAVRYLEMQGVPRVISKLVLAAAIVSSWITLRLIACLPGKRSKAAGQARAYRQLLRALG